MLVPAALREMWGLNAVEIDYAPVGFGSHHWTVTDDRGDRWFATLDDYAAVPGAVGRGAELGSAFRAARALADAGLDFVVAPEAARDGSVPVEVARHRWVSVTRWLDAERLAPPETQTPGDRRAVVEVLARLHAATGQVPGIAVTDDLALPQRTALDRALEGGIRWGAGPYGDRGRDALAGGAEAVRSALALWDEASEALLAGRESWVITHGEPHWRNVLTNEDGLHLVDWDTARLAPAARDLWHVPGEDDAAVDAVLADYADLTGRVVTPQDLRVQTLRWDLTEVALYVAWFSRPHADDADSQTAWGGFTESLSSLAAREAAA